jgi:hypothetical protein
VIAIDAQTSEVIYPVTVGGQPRVVGDGRQEERRLHAVELRQRRGGPPADSHSGRPNGRHVRGAPVPAEEVLKIVVPIARNYNGLPL